MSLVPLPMVMSYGQNHKTIPGGTGFFPCLAVLKFRLIRGKIRLAHYLSLSLFLPSSLLLILSPTSFLYLSPCLPASLPLCLPPRLPSFSPSLHPSLARSLATSLARSLPACLPPSLAPYLPPCLPPPPPPLSWANRRTVSSARTGDCVDLDPKICTCCLVARVSYNRSTARRGAKVPAEERPELRALNTD